MGRSTRGAEEIQNKDRKDIPFLTKPKMVTAKNTAIAITAVTAMWDVVVNDIGSSPRKLAQTMNMNKVIM